MSDLKSEPKTRSTSALIPALAVLAGAETIVISSDLDDGIRNGVGGFIALVLIVLVFQVSRERRRG